MKKSYCNKGVCCDVKDCVHNENGCDCSLEKIAVSHGKDKTHHFCKSYCSCVEASKEYATSRTKKKG